MKVSIYILLSIFLITGCGEKTNEVKIIAYNYTTNSLGHINSSYYKNEVPKSITNVDKIKEFNLLLSAIQNDKRYKCMLPNFSIEFITNNKNTNTLYVNTINEGENQVIIYNTNFNGYKTISLQLWENLIK